MEIYLIVLVVCSIPLYIGYGWVIFDGWAGFLECVKYWLMPDIISLARGEWGEDAWAEMKLLYWIVLCAATTYGIHWILQTYIF